MYIKGITSSEDINRARVEAEIVWEDAPRPPLKLFAEVDREFADGFWPDPNAFLTACAVPAWQAGERRIRVEAEACPLLRDRIGSVFATLKTWYPELGVPPQIEIDRTKALSPIGKQTASFLSCGIDSLAILRLNRMQLPAEHPAAIRAVLLVDFLHEYGLTPEETSRQATKRITAARAVADDIGVDVIPIATNVLRLEPDGNVFSFKWHGAALFYSCHLLSRRFNAVQLASSYDAAHLEPWGSHPILDVNYGTAHLGIEHAGLHLSRLDKTAHVADWPAGLNAIRVCQGKDSGETNCGACEKCIRTMTALTALGKLPLSAAFPHKDVTPGLLATVREYGMLYNDSQVEFYAEMLEPLRSSGRNDLAVVVESILEGYHLQSNTQANNSEWARILPPEARFVLADDQIYGLPVPGQSGGRYWGQPSDDRTAVRQLEALRQNGYDYLVIRRQNAWWLDYFPRLGCHLRQGYASIHETDRVIVFDLRCTQRSIRTSESDRFAPLPVQGGKS